MSQDISLIVYPVKDLAQATKLYGTFLGVEPYVDSAYYVGFKAGSLEVGLDPYGHSKGVTGPISYIQVSNIQESLQQLLEAGAQAQQEVQDVGGGLLIATVKDADGNILGLRQSA